MIINITIDSKCSLKLLMNILNIKVMHISRDVIWCEGFYIKFIKSNILEINIFDKNITKQYISEVLMQPIIDENEKTYIRIQKERIITQFIINKNEKINCVCEL